MTDPLREVLWVTRSDLRNSETKTRALIRKAFDDLKEIIMTNAERADAALTNIQGDITRQGNEIAQLRTDIGELLADQDAEVAAAVDAKLAEFATRAEGIAAVVPEPEPAPEPEPTPEPAPAEPAVPNPNPEEPPAA